MSHLKWQLNLIMVCWNCMAFQELFHYLINVLDDLGKH